MVGISRYPAPFNNLPAVAADVREIAKVLSSRRGAFPATAVAVLTEKQATRDQVLTALRNVFSRSKADDTLFVYLAGHGARERGGYYFVTYDAQQGRLAETGVPLAEIKGMFDRTRSRRVFLWLDFCHSGGILARGPSRDDISAIRRAIGVVEGEGKVIVAACTPGQSAYEDPSIGHGLFTHAMLRGLKGEAMSAQGEVTALSLYEFIDHQVQHPAQRPMFFGKMTGRMVLMYYPSGGRPPAAAAKAKAAKPKTTTSRRRTGTWVMLGDHFFQPDAVRHCSEGTLEIRATTTGGEDEVLFADLRPKPYGGGAPLPFAVRNDAYLARVRSVESEVVGGRQVWTLTLSIEEGEFGAGRFEAQYITSGRTWTPDEIARLRAGRILLNDPVPRSGGRPGLGSDHMLDGVIQGSGRYPVRECVIRSVFASHGMLPHWKHIARLKAVFLLKASGTVDHVLELTLGAVRSGRVPVGFRGTRSQRFGASGSSAIELSGTCPLQ